MSAEIEEKIQEGIVRRALERSYCYQKEKEKLRHTQDVLDALEELTDLPRVELEKIANEVGASYAHRGEGFFSIKNQIILLGIYLLLFIGVPILTVCLF